MRCEVCSELFISTSPSPPSITTTTTRCHLLQCAVVAQAQLLLLHTLKTFQDAAAAVSLGFWVLGFGFWVCGFGFWVLGFGFWVLGFGFWVLGLHGHVCCASVHVSHPRPHSPAHIAQIHTLADPPPPCTAAPLHLRALPCPHPPSPLHSFTPLPCPHPPPLPCPFKLSRNSLQHVFFVVPEAAPNPDCFVPAAVVALGGGRGGRGVMVEMAAR